MVAIVAALIFVNIPPVPLLEPAPPAISTNSLVISSIISNRFALGFFEGLSLYTPSTSVNKTNKSAWTIAATCALKVSLSPTFNSSIDTVSFSLIIGIA